MRQLVLASTSKYRRELLGRLGLPFETCSPGVDEDLWKSRGLSPEDLVRTLAREKARALATRFPDALIIGSDQAAEVDGEILGKPGTEAAAIAQLMRLSGREHRLLTAVALLDARDGSIEDALDVHRILLRSLSQADAQAYVRRDLPLDCAGSYKVEALGIALMARVSGDDFTAVIGLPLTRVVDLLEKRGVRLFAAG